MVRSARTALCGALAVVCLLVGCTDRTEDGGAGGAAGPSAGANFQPGAAGAGDTYFPTYGNGGYDVGRYALRLRYDPGTDQLSGTATITATARTDLSQFNLDLAHLRASAVRVDGADAGHRAE